MTFQGGAKMCFVFSLNAPKEYGDVVDKLTPLELMELNWSKFYTKCHQQLQYKNHWPFNNPDSLNTGDVMFHDVSYSFQHTNLNLQFTS